MIRCEARKKEKKRKEFEREMIYYKECSTPRLEFQIENDNEDEAIIQRKNKITVQKIRIASYSKHLHYLHLMLEKEKQEHHQKEHE